jgi:hypothetical protein
MAMQEPSWLKKLKSQKRINRDNRYLIRIHEAGHVLTALYYNLNFDYAEFTEQDLGDPEYISLGRVYCTYADYILSPNVWLIDFRRSILSCAGVAAVETILDRKYKIEYTDLSNFESSVCCTHLKEFHTSEKYPHYPLNFNTTKYLIKAATIEANSLLASLCEEITLIADNEDDSLSHGESLKILGFNDRFEFRDAVIARMQKKLANKKVNKEKTINIKIQTSIRNRNKKRIHQAGHLLAAIYFNFNFDYMQLSDYSGCEMKDISAGRKYYNIEGSDGTAIPPDNWLIDFPELIYWASGAAAVSAISPVKEKPNRLDLLRMEDVINCKKSKDLFPRLLDVLYPLSLDTVHNVIKAANKEALKLIFLLNEEITKIANSDKDRWERKDVLKLLGIKDHTELWDKAEKQNIEFWFPC